MSRSASVGMILAALVLSSSVAMAEEGREHEHEQRAPAMHQAEPHPGPTGYQRHDEPQGWNARPATVDRGHYQHNFQAARAYRIGPYFRPNGWYEHRWVYGEILPRPFWEAPYILADYWLFGLEVAPAGFEWVRVGPDAALVSIVNGEIIQMEYGVFQ